MKQPSAAPWLHWRRRLKRHWFTHWVSWLIFWFGILPLSWLIATHPWLGTRVQAEAEWLRRYTIENKVFFWPLLLGPILAGWLARFLASREEETIVDPTIADSFNHRFEEIHPVLDQLRESCCETGAARLRTPEGQPLLVFRSEYLHLCDEEYHWYQRGLLEADVWDAWVATIRHYLIYEQDEQEAAQTAETDRHLTPIGGYFVEERTKDAALACHEFFADPQVRAVWQEVQTMKRQTICPPCRAA